jgi:hypothetical protein
MPRLSKRGARKAIQLSARQMSQRMARQRVNRQQTDIHQQNQRAHAHAKLTVKKERLDNVFPQESQENDGQVKAIAMQVLQDERKPRLAAIRPLRFAYSATRRIKKKRPIVSFAVVIAGSAKAEGPAQDQNRR